MMLTTQTRSANRGNVTPASFIERNPSAGVLVVDDEEPIRMLLGLFLGQQGLPFWLAKNGVEAIDIYRRHADEIALVLLDVRMPELDGPHTLTELRSIKATVVCHLMSGNWAPYTEEELTALGAASLIPKPVPLPKLADIVRQCVTRA